MKEFTKKYGKIYQKVKNNTIKRQLFFDFLNTSFSGLESQAAYSEKSKFLLKKMPVMDFLKESGVSKKTEGMIRPSLLVLDEIDAGISQKGERSPVRSGISLEEVVKNMEFMGKVQETQWNQKNKDDFFKKLIKENIEKSGIKTGVDM